MTKETNLQTKRKNIVIAQSFNLNRNINLEEANIIFDKLLDDTIACPQHVKLFVKHWFACHLLRDFVTIKPILFFVGLEHSNATIGQQLLYILFFGETGYDMINCLEKTGVNILFSNNIISSDPQIKEFLLDKSNNKYLINTVISEIPSQELVNNNFILNSFNKSIKNNCMSYEKFEDRVLQDRDVILSAISSWSAKVITMLIDGKQEHARAVIKNRWPSMHPQLFDYLSLMHMMNVVIHLEINKDLRIINPNFVNMIEKVISIKQSITKSTPRPSQATLDLK